MQGAVATTGQLSPQQKAAQANAAGRMALLRTGIPMSQVVWNGAALALGAATRLDLLRVGITTGVMLDFTCSLDITGTMGISPAGPWPLINTITYTDFSGVNRVNTSALGLWLLNTFRHNKLFHIPLTGLAATTANEIDSVVGSIDTDILTVPTVIGATEIMYFSIYIPMAYEPSSDLRGAVPSMVNVGQHYLTITPAAALVNASDVLISPYSAGTATINSSGFTVTVTQFYIQPQSLSASMLPGIDLTTIYELNGNNITTSGFLTGAQNLINYPNDRSVMSALFVYENGGALTLNGADLTLIELLVNSNTVFRQFTPRTYRAFMRELAIGDVISGCYYMPHRRQPILTNLYATVQLRLTLGTVNSGTTKLVSQYESFYPSGQPLSGITANAG
jgi:hypothetical protein